MTIKRVNRGSWHYYTIDGVKADSVTGLIGKGLAKGGLTYWAADTAAGYAIDHWDELTRMTAEERRTLIKSAPDRARNEAAARGTKLHRLAMDLARGLDVAEDVTDEVADHVHHYVSFLDEWRVQPVLIEATVGNREHHYCGTFDLIAVLPDVGRVLIDIKTSRTVYSDVGLQLAGYRHAEVCLDPEDGDEMRMPPVDHAAVCHVRADGYELMPVRADRRVFDVFLAVAQVARTMAGSDEWIRPALDAPKVAS